MVAQLVHSLSSLQSVSTIELQDQLAGLVTTSQVLSPTSFLEESISSLRLSPEELYSCLFQKYISYYYLSRGI